MAIDYHPLPRSSTDSSSCDESFRSYCPRRSLPSPSYILRRIRRCKPIYVFMAFLAFLAWQILFNASYTHPSAFTIPSNETVFIAANIVNGDLINGPWGKSLLELVELIGENRVYVSIYGGPTPALRSLELKLTCGKTILSESEHPLNISTFQYTTLANGQQKIKRIAYLAAVRNKALEPLSFLKTRYTKVLFLNDVHFHANDAARLLWGTNVRNGKAEYKAACGADFISTWKYYDTFATRDLEGYSLGVPIFPWFSRKGDHISRRDVQAGRDNVRVKSCWGGIVAFDGRYFQPSTSFLPLSFRSEPEPFWDASECCLIHADILSIPPFYPDSYGSGIFLNPYVRVAYSAKIFKHMYLIKRVERLFAIPQAIINYFAKMPRFNQRRTEKEGDIVMDRACVTNQASDDILKPELEGEDSTRQGPGVGRRAVIGVKKKDDCVKGAKYVDVERKAGRGGYCGTKQLLIWREEGYEDGKVVLDEEGRNWYKYIDEVGSVEERS